MGRAVLLACAAFLLVLPAALIAHPVSYVSLVSILLLTAMSWAYLQVLRHGFSLSAEQMACSLERGQDVSLTIELSNASVLPSPRIEVEFFVTDLFGGYEDVRTMTCTLGSRETAPVDFTVQFAHLGSYRAGISHVVLHDLLGLFRADLSEGAQRSVVVRPRKVDLGEARAMRAMPDESRSSLRPVAADDMDYANVREYRYGDPLKTMHWNLSARNPDDVLYTRLYETYVNPSLVIVLDPYAPPLEAEDLMSLFDGMVETAAALSAQAREAGIDAEVRYLGRDGEPASTRLATTSDADDLILNMLRITPVDASAEKGGFAEETLRTAGMQSHGYGNAALITSQADAGQIEALSSIASRRRNAMAFVAVPRLLEGHDRDRFLAPFTRLDSFGAAHYLIESTEQATEVRGL